MILMIYRYLINLPCFLVFASFLQVVIPYIAHVPSVIIKHNNNKFKIEHKFQIDGLTVPTQGNYATQDNSGI